MKLTIEILPLRWQQHSFLDHKRMFLWNCRRFWDRECLGLRGLDHPTFVFMPNAITSWAIRARHLLSHVVEYWLWRYRYFVIKLTLKCKLCMRISNHVRFTNGCFLKKSVEVFETENVSTWGRFEPSTFAFMPNAITIWALRARHVLSHVIEYWLAKWWNTYWEDRYFQCSSGT